MTESAREEHKQSPADVFGLSAVRELLRLIRETDVTEIQIERGDTKLHIKRGLNPQPQYLMTPSLAATLPHSPMPTYGQPPGPAGSAPATVESESEHAPGSQLITSPMVGTFYAAASPKDPPFVQEGDAVHPSDVVGIVEAMKIMNEIESEFTGRIIRVLVTNGQPVEYGQPLMVVEPP